MHYHPMLRMFIVLVLFYQVGGDINGKLDEGPASLILDTKPSKVLSDERTVSFSISFLNFYVSCSYD